MAVGVGLWHYEMIAMVSVWCDIALADNMVGSYWYLLFEDLIENNSLDSKRRCCKVGHLSDDNSEIDVTLDSLL